MLTSSYRRAQDIDASDACTECPRTCHRDVSGALLLNLRFLTRIWDEIASESSIRAVYR